MRLPILIATALLLAAEEPARNTGPYALVASLSRTSVKDGDPILLSVTFQNHSDKPVTIYLAGFWRNHKVVVTDEHGNEPRLTDFGRVRREAFSPYGSRDKNAPHVVKKGDSWETGKDFDLAKLHDLTPGHYKVVVTYDDRFPPTPTRATSSPVAFEVEGSARPRSGSSR